MAPPTPKPTANEWSSGKDLTAAVDGAAESGCSITRVREWVRVTCGAKSPNGKAILDVSSFLRCTKGSCTSGDGNGEGELHVVKGARVVEARLPEGRTLRIKWVWADHDRDLELSWPAGEPEKAIGGRFDTNPTPHDAAQVARMEAGMRCCAKTRGDVACIGKSSHYEDESPCTKSYLRDCTKLEKCFTGELTPTCPPGEILTGSGCARKCNPKAKRPCPSAEEICVDSGFDAPVCRPMH